MLYISVMKGHSWEMNRKERGTDRFSWCETKVSCYIHTVVRPSSSSFFGGKNVDFITFPLVTFTGSWQFSSEWPWVSPYRYVTSGNTQIFKNLTLLDTQKGKRGGKKSNGPEIIHIFVLLTQHYWYKMTEQVLTSFKHSVVRSFWNLSKLAFSSQERGLCAVSKLVRRKPVSLGYLFIWVPVFNFCKHLNAEGDTAKKHKQAYLCPKPESSKGRDNSEKAPLSRDPRLCAKTLSSILPGSVPHWGPSQPQLTLRLPVLNSGNWHPPLTFKVAKINHSGYLTLGTTCFKLFFALQNVYNLTPQQQPTHRDPAPSGKLDLDHLPEHFRALPLPVNLLTLFRNWNA